MRKVSKIKKFEDKRVRHIFLLFPRSEEKEDGTRETRWLEWADIEEMLDYFREDCSYFWDFKRFVNP